MKLIASSDGVSSTNVRPRIRSNRGTDNPSSTAASAAPTNTAVPGSATTLRSAIAASGAGAGTTGGTRYTRLCRYGTGCLSDAKVSVRFIAGSPATKMKIDASMKGDQPFRTAAVECLRVTACFAVWAFPVLKIVRGCQTFRNTTITSSEKIAAMMSTSPDSWKFDQ